MSNLVFLIGSQMKITYIKSILNHFILLLLMIACHPYQEDNLKISKGYYGHLSEINHYTKAENYLIFFPQGKTYNICISENLVKKYKGIEEEIEASINAWGYYLGRKIPVRFTKVNIGIFSFQAKSKDIFERFSSKCKKNTHLMVGLTDEYTNYAGAVNQKIEGDYNNKKKKQNVQRFKKYLLINDSRRGKLNKGLITLEELTGQKRTADEILKIIIERKTTLVPHGNNTHSIPLILHEIGHVWGMCDQYDMPDGRSNCDPHHSSINELGYQVLVHDSIMGPLSPLANAYLRDDDIVGIKELERRMDIDHAVWKNTTEDPDFGLTEIPEKQRYFFSVDKIQVNSNNIKLNMKAFSGDSFKVNFYKEFSYTSRDGTIYTDNIELASYNYPKGSQELISWDTKKGLEIFISISLQNETLHKGEKLIVVVKRNNEEVEILNYIEGTKLNYINYQNIMPVGYKPYRFN